MPTRAIKMDMEDGMNKTDKRCNDCGKTFNPSLQGIAGKIDGKDINYCGPCCQKEN